jgi:hypothetical protein
MNTPDYIKARKKLKCTFQKQKIDVDLHKRLGSILLEDASERKKMEVGKPGVDLLPSVELDFMY